MKKNQIKEKKVEQKNSNAPAPHDQDDPQHNQPKLEDADPVKHEVKLENGQAPKKWYELENLEVDDDKKWDYLEHHGVTFPDPYIPRKLEASYDGQAVALNAHEEELAWYWCQRFGGEWEDNPIYRKNFEEQFMKRFLEETNFKDFNKFDFTNIQLCQEALKEEKNNLPDEEKKRIKDKKEELNKQYIYAIVDGIVERINGVVIEPPSLFKGRGAHPKAGILKQRIQPEDITLNMARDAPIPKCPLPGHSWKQIVCKKDSTWLCSYKTDVINASSAHKYIFLAANSKFKGMNDRKKYEKARILKDKISSIRDDYYQKIEDKDIRKKQLGVATYLIDTLALRVGNEKGEDEADTVGCCSLRVEHIEALSDNRIKLDFLGKDSMRYENVVEVRGVVWEAIRLFLRNKNPEDDLFDKIDAQSLNDYLKSMMEGLTAKVFRTYNASITLESELKKCEIKKGATLDEKVEIYEHANKQVAILCNHQKTVSKKQIESLKVKERSIEVLKEYVKALEKHKSHFSAKKDKVEKAPVNVELEPGKHFTMKFPETKEATIALIRKQEDKVIREEKNFKKREDNKQIALGTSKTNYNDPRISVAWCKKNEVKIERIFTKNLQSKFLWAMYTDENWTF